MKKIISILVALITLFFFNCKNSSKKIDPPKVTVDEYSVRTDFQWNGGEVAGTVTNLTAARINYLELQMQLVDNRSIPKLNFQIINQQGIEPNGTWDFRQGAAMVGARRAQIVRTIVK